MKKIMCFFVLMISVFSTTKVSASQNQYVNKSYIVINASNNKVIEGKDIHLVRSVASVSKIMTAIVAIENGNLDKEVTIKQEDIDTYGSSIYLQIGDKITLLDLVYGLMLRSGNDAAKAIARVVGGNVEGFASMMNEKALEIGMRNSTFTNPSGLDVNETGNLSTSYDLGILMSYALQNEIFLTISGTKEYKSSKGTWSNKNKLLRNYENTIAGKTGFTYKAKRTLVTAARENDTTLVVVTLDCGNDFNFHKFLYEKNFSTYETLKILDKGENYIQEYVVTCDKNIYVTIKKDDREEYSILHNIDYDYSKIFLLKGEDKEEVGRCNVSINTNSVNKKGLWDKIKDFFVR